MTQVLRYGGELLDYCGDKHGVRGADGAVVAWHDLLTGLNAVAQVHEQVVKTVSFIIIAAVVTTDPLEEIGQGSNALAAVTSGLG